jgi:hypothetical protein
MTCPGCNGPLNANGVCRRCSVIASGYAERMTATCHQLVVVVIRHYALIRSMVR